MDIKQELIDLYDAYTHGQMDRRTFFDRFTRVAGGAAAAAILLPLIQADPAAAAIVDPDDPRLKAVRVTYPSPNGPIRAYQVEPAAPEGQLSSVIVVHENRGLNPHIEDVTRRAALAGYRALGVDLLSPFGGTPPDPDAARTLFSDLDPQDVVTNTLAAMPYLKSRPAATEKVGIVGFCWGGGVVGDVAVSVEDLTAAVVFYGRAPNLAKVPKIGARLLMHYAALDQRINATVFPSFINALEAAGKDFTSHVYEGAQHAFHNETAGARFKEDAARLAWQRTVDFFAGTLLA